MSGPNVSAEITLAWPDGERLYALKLKQIEEIQRQCGAGLGAIAKRLFNRDFYFADIYELIRLGMIGGGEAPARAKELVDTYVDGQPMADPRAVLSPLVVAELIMKAAYFGVEDEASDEEDVPGKAGAAAGDRTGGSTSRRTTAKPGRSTGRSRKSRASASPSS